MKVMCIYGDNGPLYVRSGWGHAFRAIGYKFYFWKHQQTPAFDAFNDVNPDFFIGTTYDLDRATIKNIKARPNMKVALFGSAWGPLIDKIPGEYPLVRTTKREAQAIQELKAETGKPDFVFIHVTDKYLEQTMSGWRSIGVEPVGILNAADTFIYGGGTCREDLSCDVAFVGGYWGYKGKNLNKYMLPLCQTDLRVKLFGNQPWPVANYLGLIDDRDVKDLFVSAKVCPNVSEPHSTDFGFDCIERLFKVPYAGGCCVSDCVDEAKEIFGDALPMAASPREFEKLIRHYMANESDRQSVIKETQKTVCEAHTYFDRVAKMLTSWDMPAEAARCMEVKKQWV